MKSDINTQLALKHQQLMNMKTELVKRKLPKNFLSLKLKSQDGLKIKKTQWKTLHQHTVRYFERDAGPQNRLVFMKSSLRNSWTLDIKDTSWIFAWLWTKAQKLQTEIDLKVEIRHHVIVLFLQRTQTRMRSKKRNKKKPKQEKVPKLMKRHATLREKCIWTSANETSYVQKWGRYKPTDGLNIDQSPSGSRQKDLQIYSIWSRLYI